MIERKDIVRGMILVSNKELTLVNNKTYEDAIFPTLTEFTVSYLSKEKRDPRLTLSHAKKSYHTLHLSFDDLCQCLDIHILADAHHMKLHNKRLNQDEVLKKIKKIAPQDDLEEILELVDDNYFQSIKNVKTLMMYAIQSKELKILRYGFEHNWFKKIDFNENVAIGATIATPLYYAILKSTKEVQCYLIEQGASLSNSFQACSKESIEVLIEEYTGDLSEQELNDLKEFEMIVKEKKQLIKIQANSKLSNKPNKL